MNEEIQFWSKVFQVKVYEFASKVIKEKKLKSVLDIGCGYPSKLEKFILPLTKDIVGIDMGEKVNMAKELNFGEWIDFEIGEGELDLNRKFDFIISADFIEHIDNPNDLFKIIKKHTDGYILISTPDGSTTRKSNGKPAHILHKIEWTGKEFENLLIKSGFKIISSSHYTEHNGEYPYVCNYFLIR